jgi:predicted nucleic acid-binding protein
MVQRFYFDTSVFGGIFDEEFETESQLLFDMVHNGIVRCVYSELSEKELQNAPERVKAFFQELNSAQLERIQITEECYQLAKMYIDEKVVGHTSFDDCLHIATATLNKVDILVSWNFKHIVNIFRIRGYNSVNLRLGHGTLEIRSPREIVSNDNED